MAQPANNVTIVTLDIGTSSTRTLLFDAYGKQVEGFGAQLPYHVTTTPDGGWEVDADQLTDLAAQSISAICKQLRDANIRPSGVAVDTFWHNLAGIGSDGKPVTPIIHLFDTRSAEAAKRLAQKIDNREQHARTGCVLHPSYLPAKLVWLSETRPDAFRAARQWMSIGEYIYLKFFGTPMASTSMASGSGLWNQNENDYDAGILDVLPIDKKQLAPADEMDQPLSDLRPEYRAQWPELNGIPWFPELGDGACDNVGSGCIGPDRFALMVGTSGALRAVIEQPRIEIPDGLWCYRLDRRRFVMGGALSNGGEVFAWMKRTLALPAPEEIEKQIAAMPAGAHGLTVLPLFAGERSTKWRADARAAIIGMASNTSPMDILRASLESVSLRFRNIYDIMLQSIGAPREVIASGGALLHSPAWTRMMADALGHNVVACLEKEATSRGAALMAMERLGIVQNIQDLPAQMGEAFQPVESNHQIYEDELRKQRRLYTKLFEEN
ncbi:MAG: gluconokinase [Acidobacteriota bacterium]|nr:gluconokinase [Acidobacteriota bacterium]